MLMNILIVLWVFSAPQSLAPLPSPPRRPRLQMCRRDGWEWSAARAVQPCSLQSARLFSKWGQLCKQAPQWRITDRLDSLLRHWTSCGNDTPFFFEASGNMGTEIRTWFLHQTERWSYVVSAELGVSRCICEHLWSQANCSTLLAVYMLS